jgi:hypothetical protein
MNSANNKKFSFQQKNEKSFHQLISTFMNSQAAKITSADAEKLA